MNDLVKKLLHYPNTLREARLYIMEILGSKERAIQLESAPVSACIPYYINYIEKAGLDFLEALVSLSTQLFVQSFWELQQNCIVWCFHKIEVDDPNLVPY